jgi:DNA-binding NarL/FixJ family response regulator
MTNLLRQVQIVDDEYLIVMGLTHQVEDMGLTVCGTAATAPEAVNMARRLRPALVLMDMRLDGPKDGVDAAQEIFETIGSKVIFITGSQDPATVVRIRTDHPSAILFKPVSDQQLRTAIDAAIGLDQPASAGAT